jgi:molecular chaperone IbpA
MAQAPDGENLRKGIAARPFEHRFRLEDHVEVQAASLENGLLEIDLFRSIPEAMKTRQIEIGSSANGANGKSASKKEIERTG